MRLFIRTSLLVFILSTVYSATGYAQSIHTLSGTVADESSGSPVEFAQIALYEAGGQETIKGTLSEEDGSFSLEVPNGTYRLEISFIGYKQKTINDIAVFGSNVTLGVVNLNKSPAQLDEVTVTGEEIWQPVSANPEGLVIRPDQSLNTTGGSLLDILRNIPSLNVSDDGSVSIRGSDGTQILVNGRNSALTTDLEQIPASIIERIKIVNNPNAKYDAESSGGVINIALKRGEKRGTNSTIEISGGTRGRFNGAARMNHRNDRFNVYGGYNFRHSPRLGSVEMERILFDEQERLDQERDSERKDIEHSINAGGDYFFGSNKISYEGTFNTEDETDEDRTFTDIYNQQSEDLMFRYSNLNRETEDNITLDNALIYERLFAQKKRDLRVVFSHSIRDQLEEQDVDHFSGYDNIPDNVHPSSQERSTNDELRTRFIAQADYVHPIKNGKIEAGLKSSFESYDNDYLYEEFQSGEWISQPNISNRFVYREQVHAAYAILSTEIDSLELSGGVRAEQTRLNNKLHNTGNSSERTYFGFFPSASLVYNLDRQHALKASYSRRIDRPGSWSLNPFPDISDSLNVHRGNPSLDPEYINSFEVGHLYSVREKVSITTNLFVRHTTGIIDYVVNVDEGVSVRMPVNLNSSTSYGLEVIHSAKLFEWLDVNGSFSWFRTDVDATNLSGNYTNSGDAWNAKLTANIDLPAKIDLQVSGNYTAPEIEAQGRDFARYSVDAGFTRKFLDNRLEAQLSMRDVFDTRNFRGENFGENFVQRFTYDRPGQIVMLSLSYKLLRRD